METKPLPCPFCDHIGVSIVESDTHKWRAAQCNNCGARAGDVRWLWKKKDPDAEAKTRAIIEWNKRHGAINAD
jgi:transcription elongation factor Elf1